MFHQLLFDCSKNNLGDGIWLAQKKLLIEREPNIDCIYGSNDYEQIDVNEADKYGRTALFLSCSISHSKFNSLNLNLTKLCQFLIENGANINQCDNYRLTPLYKACLCRLTPNVKQLIKAGANVNLANDHGITPLMTTSIMKERLDCMELLLEAGVDVNLKSDREITAIQHTVSAWNPGAFRRLLLVEGINIEGIRDFILENRDCGGSNQKILDMLD